MSRARKLQSEIDLVLRKITDGVNDWDVLWNKLEETEDPSQRDKIAVEMKKELKKLQRLREQARLVRGWAASGDIKDDSRLTDARRSIERQMERFKTMEKELKIKAFSSAGLMRDSTDPVMVAKVKCADWLSDMLSQLETQVEQFEADVEAMGPAPKGRKPPRVAELEGFMQKHAEHVTKLEQVLRLLENDQVTPEEVEGALKEGIEYYLASCTESDFMADEHLYDSLPLLKEVPDSIGKITAHTPRAGKHEGEGGEAGAEGAAEGGKSKRSKAAKERKAKAMEQAAAKATKAAIPPPPGLPPPPPASPAAASTPSAAAGRGQAAKVAAGAGAKAAGSPIKASPGGPETPAPGMQVGAAGTPVAQQRPRTWIAAAAPHKAAAPVAPSAADSAGASEGAGAAGPPGAKEPSALHLAPPLMPPAAAAPAAQPQPPPPALLQQAAPASPAAAPALGEQCIQRQQGSPAAPLLPPPPPPLEPMPQAALPVLSVPPGLPRVALGSAHSFTSSGNGHSPFAALPGAVAAGSPFASPPRQFSPSQISQGGSVPPSPAAAAPGADTSPPSVEGSWSGSEVTEGRRLAAADAAAALAAHDIAAAAAAAGTPHAHGRIPLVLSFNHLSQQAESVLTLAAVDGMPGAMEEGGGRAAAAEESEEEGEGHRLPQLPWIPALHDLQVLEASVASRPQPGDGDWQLEDGTVSLSGAPPPAQHPTIVPASYPNQVHPALRREDTYKKLSAETHFFSFYFQQNTRQQLFAANALKAQGWRFHTQFNAWFARQSQPRAVTADYEQGNLLFFDSNLHDVTPSSPGIVQTQRVFSGWCPRVSRPDFLFEYKFMESEDTSCPSDPPPPSSA